MDSLGIPIGRKLSTQVIAVQVSPAYFERVRLGQESW